MLDCRQQRYQVPKQPLRTQKQTQIWWWQEQKIFKPYNKLLWSSKQNHLTQLVITDFICRILRLQVFHDFDTIHFLTAVIVKLNRLNIAKSNYCFEIIVYSSVKVFPAQTQRQLACSCTSS